MVDATGRAALVSRAMGARLQRSDRLIAIWRVFPTDKPIEPITLIEATPTGWWYTTTVPSGPVTVVSLLQQAQQEFATANNALAKSPPDFAAYAQHTQKAQALIKQALQLAQSQGVTVPSTSIPTASSTTTTSVP